MSWDWFNNPDAIKEILPIKPKIKCKNYHNISKDKVLVKKEILENPEVIFKVVDSESNCMCGGTCGCCEYDDVLFIDLIIRAKSFNEADILDLLNNVTLDMYKLCKYVPFSINTLKKYEDKVDWKLISYDYKYNKNIDFINNFHDKLDWERIDNFYKLSSNDIEQCVFIDKYVPIKIAISKHILNSYHIKKYVDVIAPYCNYLIGNYVYDVKILEELDDSIISPFLIKHVEKYTNRCIEIGFLTKKYVKIISLSDRIRQQGDWSNFIIKCKPDEAFLLEHVVNKEQNPPHLSKETWNAISETCKLSNEFISDYSNYLNWNILVKKSNCNLSFIEAHIKDLDAFTISTFQKLTPEFIEFCIENYPEKLDWYYLCEFQDLPEDLMRRNIDKLNWGQVSWYQMMSKNFLNEHDKMINKVKLNYNTKLKPPLF